MKCNTCKKEASLIKGKVIEGKYVEVCNNCTDIAVSTMGGNGDGGVTAIYADQKGNTYAVNKKGNIVENHNNPYRNDARGWKYAGKKNIKY